MKKPGRKQFRQVVFTNHSFGGKELRTDNPDDRWDRLRELAYENVSKS